MVSPPFVVFSLNPVRRHNIWDTTQCFRALEELGKVGAVELVTDKGRMMLRSDIEGLSNQILRTLGAKIPSQVLSKTH